MASEIENENMKKQAVGSSSPSPRWIELPQDVTGNILRRLDALEILERVQKVCSTWWKVSHDPTLWRAIHIRDKDTSKIKFWRRAVDRSKGQLVDLTIDFFADDKMLNSIADRSTNLKRLTLYSCSKLTSKGLIEALKKLPHLEELHLILTPFAPKDVEAFGISSPKLTSFTFSVHKYVHTRDFEYDSAPLNDDHALAIAKAMPNLSTLVLVGDCMGNKGLEAILESCSKFENLDLRQCINLDLKGPLGQRCSQQIKHLKKPSESVDDVDWIFQYSSDNEWAYGCDCCALSSDDEKVNEGIIMDYYGLW